MTDLKTALHKLIRFQHENYTAGFSEKIFYQWVPLFSDYYEAFMMNGNELPREYCLPRPEGFDKEMYDVFCGRLMSLFSRRGYERDCRIKVSLAFQSMNAPLPAQIQEKGLFN